MPITNWTVVRPACSVSNLLSCQWRLRSAACVRTRAYCLLSPSQGLLLLLCLRRWVPKLIAFMDGRCVHVCTAKRTNLAEAHNPPSGTSPLNRNPKVGRVLAYLGYLGASATSDMSDGTRDDVDPRACAATLLEDGLSDLASQGSVIDVDISSSSI